MNMTFYFNCRRLCITAPVKRIPSEQDGYKSLTKELAWYIESGKKVKTLKSCTKHCWPFPLQVWLLRECSALLVGCSTREEHQWVIPPWMILFSWSLTLNAKKVTKMSVSDLPYLLPSWQNILCSLFVRFCRQKTSFFSFFDKNKFSRNLEGLVTTLE